MADERKDCQRVMSNAAVLFIGLFISSLSLKAQVLSPLTIAEAHAKEAELTARIESVSKSAPPLAPKDMFESTADFNARKQKWAEAQEQRLKPLRSELEKLKTDLYVDPMVRPEFVSYDADLEWLSVQLRDEVLKIKVPKKTAKTMYDAWSSVSYASNKADSGLLVFRGEVFPALFGSGEHRCKGGIPVKVGNGVTAPSVIFKVEPEYPEAARQVKMGGTVMLSIVVGADGKACDIVVIKQLGLDWDKSAVEAVSKWKFKPGLKDGVPANVIAQAAVNFRLLDSSLLSPWGHASLSMSEASVPQPALSTGASLRGSASDSVIDLGVLAIPQPALSPGVPLRGSASDYVAPKFQIGRGKQACCIEDDFGPAMAKTMGFEPVKDGSGALQIKNTSVSIIALIGTYGRVHSTTLSGSLGSRGGDYIVEGFVRRQLFVPGTTNGIAVSTRTTIKTSVICCYDRLHGEQGVPIEIPFGSVGLITYEIMSSEPVSDDSGSVHPDTHDTETNGVPAQISVPQKTNKSAQSRVAAGSVTSVRNDPALKTLPVPAEIVSNSRSIIQGSGSIQQWEVLDDLTDPTVITQKQAGYSQAALDAKVVGTVTLSIVVDAVGKAQEIKVMKSIGYGLDEKAIEAVKQWRFKPGMKNGVPVSVRGQVEVKFQLAGASGGGIPCAAVVSRGCMGVTSDAGGDGGGGVKNFGDPLAAMIRRSAGSGASGGGIPGAAGDYNRLGVTAPSVLFKVDPESSEEARTAKVNGTVLLSVVVDSEGHARDIKVLKGPGMGLDEKAVEAVQKWKFKPGMKDGSAVNVPAQIEVNFRLL